MNYESFPPQGEGSNPEKIKVPHEKELLVPLLRHALINESWSELNHLVDHNPQRNIPILLSVVVEELNYQSDRLRDRPELLIPLQKHCEALGESLYKNSSLFFNITNPDANPNIGVEQAVSLLTLLHDWEGIQQEKLVNALLDGCNPYIVSELAEYVVKTCKQMCALENKRSGTLAYLHAHGIYQVVRYPAESLLKQYELHADPEKHFCLLIVPAQDHNGALSSQGSSLSTLQKDLEALGATLIIIECNSLLSLTRSILSLPRQADSTIILAHGNEERIVLNLRESSLGSTLDIDALRADLINYSVQKNGTFVVSACYGADFAQRIHELSGIESIGNTGLVQSTKYEVVKSGDDGTIAIYPIFSDSPEGSTKRFQ